jgi:NADH dehydrogenase [ubiquinone] 1 alpha subcomplex assembly factor 7
MISGIVLTRPDNSTTPFIIAHEFFDALPIHVFQAIAPSSSSSSITTSTTSPPPSRRLPKSNEWRELLVAPTSPQATIAATSTEKSKAAPEFELIQSKIPTPHSQYLPNISERYKKLLSVPDSVIEISPESLALAADFATRIGGPASGPSTASGAALILDYGPAATIPTNSLRGIKAHQMCSLFASPGQVDISADVDFIALAEAALNASPHVEVHGPAEQATFLGTMGIKERAQALIQKAGGDKVAAERIEIGWKRLVDRGPNGMGKTYKAMAIIPHVPNAKMRRPVGFGGDIVT